MGGDRPDRRGPRRTQRLGSFGVGRRPGAAAGGGPSRDAVSARRPRGYRAGLRRRPDRPACPVRDPGARRAAGTRAPAGRNRLPRVFELGRQVARADRKPARGDVRTARRPASRAAASTSAPGRCPLNRRRLRSRGLLHRQHRARPGRARRRRVQRGRHVGCQRRLGRADRDPSVRQQAMERAAELPGLSGARERVDRRPGWRSRGSRRRALGVRARRGGPFGGV